MFIQDRVYFFKKIQLKDAWYFNNKTLMFVVIGKGFISQSLKL